MAITVKLRNLRIAPRKVRLVADLIRGKGAVEAQTALSFTTKKAARPTLKLLNSAVAAASNNFQLEAASLYISKITVDEGAKYKRWLPRARGQASEIQKKTSHITIVLDEVKGAPKKVKRVKKVQKIEKAPVPSLQEDKKPKIKTPKPRIEKEMPRPETKKGIRRVFKRKAF